MEKQDVIDRVLTATNRALSEEKPEMIYAVVGALQRLAHAGLADEDGQKLVENLNWSNGNNTENSNNEDNRPAESNADATGSREDLGTSGQHQAERIDQPDNNPTA